MGQYWIPVNLDKKEYIDPHKLACGLKLYEQLANHPGTGVALIILTAIRRPDDAGNLDYEDRALAQRTFGRWAGDRIAIVGDYAEDSDLAPEHKAGSIYNQCDDELDDVDGKYTDITADVQAVIVHELGGKFTNMDGSFWTYVPPA